MIDNPNNFADYCVLCNKLKLPFELNPCIRKTLINDEWVQKQELMCTDCQEKLNEDKDKDEGEDILYETCKGCNGSGVEHHPDYPPCSACEGNGVVESETKGKTFDDDYAIS